MKKRAYNVFKFPNGFRVAWQKTASNTIFGSLVINHGALHEKEGEEGIAHMLEHMLLEGGTEKYTPEEQEKMRGNFGYTNAFTSRDRTTIACGMNSSDLEKYLDLASQMVFYPVLDSKILKKQKEIVKREIARKKGSPSFNDYFKFYWPNLARNRDHTYFVLGEEKVINDLTVENLRDFHRRGYSPNNMTLMMAGDLPLNMENIAAKYFANEKAGFGNPFEFSRVFPLQSQSILYSLSSDLINKDNPKHSNAELMMGIVVPDEFHEDSQNLSILNELLGKSWSRGLIKRIRSEEGISYDICSIYNGQNKFGYFGVHGKVLNNKKERAIEIIFEELNKLKNSTVDKTEVETAKNRVSYRASTAINRFNLFINLDPINVGAIARMDYDFDNRLPIEEKLSRINNVNNKTVQFAASKYLPSDRHNDNYVLLVRTPFNSK